MWLNLKIQVTEKNSKMCFWIASNTINRKWFDLAFRNQLPPASSCSLNVFVCWLHLTKIDMKTANRNYKRNTVYIHKPHREWVSLFDRSCDFDRFALHVMLLNALCKKTQQASNRQNTQKESKNKPGQPNSMGENDWIENKTKTEVHTNEIRKKM